VLPADSGDGSLDPKLLTRNLAKCFERFKAQKIRAFTLHDLRRTCRTGLARLKIEPHITERVLNHVQERISGTHIGTSTLRKNARHWRSGPHTERN
jgi:hypothetical protein